MPRSRCRENLVVGLVKKVKLEMGDEELKSIALTQLVKKLANRLSDGTPESAAFEYLDHDFGEWVDLDDPQAAAGVPCIKIRVKAPQKAAEEVLFYVLCAWLLTSRHPRKHQRRQAGHPVQKTSANKIGGFHSRTQKQPSPHTSPRL